MSSCTVSFFSICCGYHSLILPYRSSSCRGNPCKIRPCLSSIFAAIILVKTYRNFFLVYIFRGNSYRILPYFSYIFAVKKPCQTVPYLSSIFAAGILPFQIVPYLSSIFTEGNLVRSYCPFLHYLLREL